MLTEKQTEHAEMILTHNKYFDYNGIICMSQVYLWAKSYLRKSAPWLQTRGRSKLLANREYCFQARGQLLF